MPKVTSRASVIHPDKFYVYALFKPTSYSPFYIGKGRGQRINAHFHPANLSKNTPKTAIIKKYGNSIKREILCYFDDESKAYDFEEYLISYYGLESEGGCLVNYAKTRFQYSDKFVEDVCSKARLNREYKYSKEVVFSVYDKYFKDKLEIYEVATSTGISENYIYYLLSGKKHKYLFEEYVNSNPLVDTEYLGRPSRVIRKRPDAQKIKDEVLVEAFHKVCDTGCTVQSIADEIGVNAGWLSSVFVGKDRAYLTLDYEKYRNIRKGRANSKVSNLNTVKSLLEEGKTVMEIKEITGFGRTTVFRYVREIKLGENT
jgi:hypothetical protein